MQEDLKTQLKEADQNHDTSKVLELIKKLLDHDFDGSVKLVVKGGKRMLLGGALQGRYAKSFWASDLPVENFENFRLNPEYRTAFWERCLQQQPLPKDCIQEALRLCPNFLENGIRKVIHKGIRKETPDFLKPHVWEPLKAILDNSSLSQFIEDCERIKERHERSIQSLKSFNDLLGKIATETIVIQFSGWLEVLYFSAESDFAYKNQQAGYIEVLEYALNDAQKHRNKTRKPRDRAQVEADIKRFTIKASEGGEIKGDLFVYFEAIELHLNLLYNIELFCAHSGQLTSAGDKLTVILPTAKQQEAWQIAQWKFFVFDQLQYTPTNEEEFAERAEILTGSPNEESAQSVIEMCVARRLLTRLLGEQRITEFEKANDISVSEILTVLNSYKACMLSQFWDTREKLKEQDLGASTSYLIPANRVEASIIMPLIYNPQNQQPLNLRQPMEARPLNTFSELTDRLLGKGMPGIGNKARKIFDLLSQDIYDTEINLQKTVLLKTGQCDLLLPRLWFSDLKGQLFNLLFNLRIDNKPIDNKPIGDIFENHVTGIFKMGGFEITPSFPLHTEDKQAGEIDLLAYKDNTLFVIEAKMTYWRERPQQIENVSQTYHKASSQLRRAIRLLPNYWNKLHTKLKAPESLESIKVIPLIVSNSFEFDHLYYDDILKVSDFELNAIMQNNPLVNFQMAQSFETSTQMTESQIIERTQHNWAMSEEDRVAQVMEHLLYPEKESPSAREVIEALETNRFWSLIFQRDCGLTPLLPSQ